MAGALFTSLAVCVKFLSTYCYFHKEALNSDKSQASDSPNLGDALLSRDNVQGEVTKQRKQRLNLITSGTMTNCILEWCTIRKTVVIINSIGILLAGWPVYSNVILYPTSTGGDGKYGQLLASHVEEDHWDAIYVAGGAALACCRLAALVGACCKKSWLVLFNLIALWTEFGFSTFLTITFGPNEENRVLLYIFLSFCFTLALTYPHARFIVEDRNGFHWTEFFSQPITGLIQGVALISARNPWLTILLVSCTSVGLLVAGLSTNFRLEVDEGVLWTPFGSSPERHSRWIEIQSGFRPTPRVFQLLFHREGNTSLIEKGHVSRIFEALDEVRSLPGYRDLCQLFEDEQCEISGITNFWRNDANEFAADNRTISETIASATFPDGRPAQAELWLGRPEYSKNGLVVGAQTVSSSISFPADDASFEFEEKSLDVILSLEEVWSTEGGGEGTPLRVEVKAARSFRDEFTRAVLADFVLIPVVFVIMTFFTAFVFWENCLIGICAVVCVLMTSGFLFILGVPFTSITTLVPFV